MKTASGVVLAVITLIVAWAIVAVGLLGLGWLGAALGHGSAAPIGVVLASWIVGPGVGGYVAMRVAPEVVRGIAPAALYTAFATCIVTLGLVFGGLAVLLLLAGRGTVGTVVLTLAQTGAIVLGAMNGRRSDLTVGEV